MSDPIIISIVSVVGAWGGAGIGAWIQRDGKQTAEDIEKLERKAERFRSEAENLQAVERIAEEWLVELGQAKTPLAAMRLLRNRTEEKTGLRPKLSPRDVSPP